MLERRAQIQASPGLAGLPWTMDASESVYQGPSRYCLDYTTGLTMLVSSTACVCVCVRLVADSDDCHARMRCFGRRSRRRKEDDDNVGYVDGHARVVYVAIGSNSK